MFIILLLFKHKMISHIIYNNKKNSYYINYFKEQIMQVICNLSAQFKRIIFLTFIARIVLTTLFYFENDSSAFLLLI